MIFSGSKARGGWEGFCPESDAGGGDDDEENDYDGDGDDDDDDDEKKIALIFLKVY